MNELIRWWEIPDLKLIYDKRQKQSAISLAESALVWLGEEQVTLRAALNKIVGRELTDDEVVEAHDLGGLNAEPGRKYIADLRDGNSRQTSQEGDS